MKMWRTIPEMSQYEASNEGEIRHIKRKRILKTKNNGKGYLYISFRKNKKVVHRYVHRIVAMVFVKNDNPETKRQVNHKDGNKANNNADNLEWVSHKENLRHARDIGLLNRTSDKKVAQIDDDNCVIAVYRSAREAGKSVNRCGECISAACRGEVKKSGGYKWVYISS